MTDKIKAYAALKQREKLTPFEYTPGPLGANEVEKMIDFCSRHKIEPVTETFKMSQINEALEHLKQGKARYRIVLTNDRS